MPPDARAPLFALLADPVRLGVIVALAKDDRAAGDLARELRVTPSRLANQLRRLLEAGVVTVRADGRRRYYRLRHPELTRFLKRADAVAALTGGGAPTRRRP